MIELSPHKAIPIETADQDSTGFCPLIVGSGEETNEHCLRHREEQEEIHWKTGVEKILTYHPTEAIQVLIQRKIVQSLDEIEDRILFINESNDVDFTWVVAHRFAAFSPVFEQLGIERKRISASGL